MYNIEQTTYSKLLNYFQNNLDIQKVILFGSRAKRTATHNSDIDLYITYTGNNKGTLVFEIEDLVGVYSLDIVFEGKIGEELQKQIERDGIEIYKK